MASASQTQPMAALGRPWLRHGVAVLASLAVNLALALALAQMTGPRASDVLVAIAPAPVTLAPREDARPALQTPAARAPAALAPARAAAEPALPEPVRAPALPELDLPALEAPGGSSGLDLARSGAWTAVPAYRASSAPTAGAPGAGAEALPGDGLSGPAAGPVGRRPELTAPPDLSGFYPLNARRRGTTGRSVVRVAVDARGRVTGVDLVSSRPAGVFDAAAVRAARTLLFRPAVRDGRPVPGTTRVTLLWEIE